MFRFVVICGCLMAVAHAGFINGGLLTAAPISAQPIAVQPTLALRPAIATASSSSNIVRGIGPLGTTFVGGRTVVTGQQGLTTLLAPSGVVTGLAGNSYALGGAATVVGLL